MTDTDLAFETDETLEDDTRSPEPSPKRKPRQVRSRSAARTARAHVRQAAEKAQQLSAATPDERDFLAELIGAQSADVVDLTVAILEAKRNPVADAVDDLHTIQESELPAATVYLVGMDKAAHEGLARLLRVVSTADLPERIPSRATDAALVLIEPVREAEVDRSSLDRLLELLAR